MIQVTVLNKLFDKTDLIQSKKFSDPDLSLCEEKTNPDLSRGIRPVISQKSEKMNNSICLIFRNQFIDIVPKTVWYCLQIYFFNFQI